MKVTDSGRTEAADSADGVAVGAAVGIAGGVAVGGAVTSGGAAVGVIDGRTGGEGLVQPESTSTADVVTSHAGTLIPMKLERSLGREGSAAGQQLAPTGCQRPDAAVTEDEPAETEL